MKNLFCIILFFFYLQSYIIAQNLSKQVIASGGTTLSNMDLRISYTIGESVIQTFLFGDYNLGQGFHQSSEFITNTHNDKSRNFINVYPNPVAEEIHIELISEQNEKTPYNLVICNMDGAVLFQKQNILGLHNMVVNVSPLLTGKYVIFIRNHINSIASFGFIKL